MCGIVGIVGTRAGERVREALGTIVHRGPDSQGFKEGRDWAMGIRRLSIIDVATGDQPIANEDETIWVVCNGEIYNHDELRKRLMQRGHRFRTSSDVEVVVHLYEEYGAAFVEHLQGMFGLFLATPDGCFIARDRLGIKPLYRTRTSTGVGVASEIRALFELPGVPAPGTDDDRIADYFAFRYVPEPRTAFVGIDRVPAGHVVHIKNGVEKTWCYWPLTTTEAFAGTFDEAVSECETRLEAIVKTHLMSERPIGVFLSGGVDSSVITALAAREAGRRLSVLTAAFPGSDLDETAYAREVASHFGVDHHVVELSPSAFDCLQDAVEVMEDLVADPAVMPILAISRRARQFLTVALLGEGSDETNVGYQSFLEVKRLSDRRRLAQWLPSVVQNGRWARKLGYPGADACDFLAHFTNTPFAIDECPPFLPHLTRLQDRIAGGIRRLVPDAHLSPLARNRRYRLKAWMKDDLLMKVDKATMAASIEARVPFLDHTYVEWSLRLSDDYVLRRGRTKAVLRTLASRLLPERIATRKQHGFLVPIASLLQSMNRSQLRGTLLRPDAVWRRVFVEAPILRLIQRFEAGDSATAFFLYQLLNAELWRERWVDRKGIAFTDRSTAA